MEIAIYDIKGEQVDSVAFDESCLGKTIHYKLLHEAIVMYEANRRQGTASAKTRSEVVGCKRKPWRQKGTGRARHGARTSPIWTGGGVTHGPRPRDWRKKMPRRARRLATKSALLGKLRDEEVKVVDAISQEAPKTREMAAALRNLNVDGGCLVVIRQLDPILLKSFRNIPSVDVLPLSDLNAYDLLRRKHVLFTREAFEALPEEVK